MLGHDIGGFTQNQYEALENDLEKIGFRETLRISKSTLTPSSNAFTEA